ncbi:Protein HIR2 [Pichia kudriavzevii]|uniref:Protein HIR n=1 Tax=Pichia kudriavzevii TaxID=4909 RepID=A0A1V2LTK6_PICKU|nr:Protein HIR2 [Pichia kudriavzevii]
MATASNEGNITIRSIAKIQELYENTENKLIPTTNTNIDPLKKYTTQFEVAKTPELDTMKLQQAQQILNTVNVRSRSKITCLRYANLLTNSNLLAAVYKNGEVYIITTPQDPAKCRVQQIFKYTNGQVADFVWSADDQLMAFSTFNNKVIIYDVIYGKVLATLNPHYNIETLNPKGNKIEISATPIKGIAFDRLGNDTLCTLGDDKILNIVKYKLVSDVILGRIFQYEIVQELNDIVSSSKLNKSAIDKISFSPDDDLIVLPNTSKNKAMKLTVLRRDNKTYQLNNELSAVGFKSYMSLFSPRKTEATKQEKTRDSVNEKREKKDTTDTKRPEKAEKVNKAEKTEKVSKVTKVEKTEKAENMEKDNSRKENPKKRPHPTSNYELSSTSVPKDIHLRVAKMSRKESSQNGTTAQAPSKKRKEVEPVEFVGTVIINPQISFSNIRIAIPKLKKAIGYSFIDDETLSLQVTNGNGLESQPTRIALIKQISRGEPKQLFVDFIPHKVHVVSGSSHYIAVSTQNGQIITYTQSGSRILPALILGSPLSFLELKDEYLLAVTCTGELFVWNLKERKALFKSISLYPLLQPLYSSGQASATNVDGEDSNVNLDGNNLVFLNGELLTKSENVTLCSITSQGIPIVTLSNGNGYLFNKDMNTWSLISDSWWAFGSQYWDSSLSAESTKGIGLLEYMESHTNEEINRRGKAKFFIKISKMMLMREGYENLETIISLNHLENKINFYMSMDDYKNYKLYLIIYAKRLSELNLKARLIEVLSSLFNDMDGSICGHAKRELLEEVLLSCSKHREVQDILVPFSESVGILNHKGGSDIDVL